MGKLNKVLHEKCGSACVEVWNNAVAAKAGSNRTSGLAEWYAPLIALADVAQQQLRSAEQVKHDSAIPSLVGVGEKRKSIVTHYLGATDTACTSPASCKLKSMIANRCNFGREALQTAYQTFNLVAHTMGAAITVLCGCLFVQEHATCALQ